MSLAPPFPHLAERFAWLIDRVTREIGDRLRRWPLGASPGLIPLERVILIQAWLFRRRRDLKELMARFAGGTLRPRRPYQSRPRPPDAPPLPGRRPPPPEQERISTRFGWLCSMAGEVRRYGVWLGELAAEPQVRELAAATPEAGRLLRPLLRMLGEEVPEWLKPPPRPRRARPPKPQRPPKPPDPEPLRPLAKRYAGIRRWKHHRAEETAAAPEPPAPPPAVPAAAVPPSTAPPAQPPKRPPSPWRWVDMSR